MKRLIYICVIVTAMGQIAAFAESDGKGGQPAAFRDISVGGRASALGGAFTAIAEGGVGHLYNPAGLAQTRLHNVAFSYRFMDLDRRLGYASGSIPAKEDAQLGFSWIYAGTSDLAARDDQGNILEGQEVGYHENLIGATFAKRAANWIIFGGRAFYAQNNIANINAYTVGIDLGALSFIDLRKTSLQNYFPLLRLGAVVENLGASYRWTTGAFWQTRGRDTGAEVDESFPVNYRLGAALSKPNEYLLTTDLEMNSASVFTAHFGAEYTYRRMLALRAGLDDFHPTFGIGIYKQFSSLAIWTNVSYLLDKVGEGDDILVSFELVF